MPGPPGDRTWKWENTLTVGSRGTGGAVDLVCVPLCGAKCSCRARHGEWCSAGAEETSRARRLVGSAGAPVAIKPSQAITWSTTGEKKWRRVIFKNPSKSSSQNLRCLLFHRPALCPFWQKIPGGQRDPVLLSVGFGTVAPIRQRKPGAQDPEGSTKPPDPQNWPAGHTRHSPANTDRQLWLQS